MMLIFYQEQLTHNASLPQSSCHPTTTHKMCSQRHAPQMFSLICPKINLKAKGNTHPDQKDIDNGKDFNTMNLYDSEVVIHNGQLMSGIVDKKTIGIQRRLVKAMETVMSRYDGTLRTSNGSIVQFLYGEDGMDAVWIEKQAFPSLTMKESKFAATYKMDTSDEQFGIDAQGNFYLEETTIRKCRELPEIQILAGRHSVLQDDLSSIAGQKAIVTKFRKSNI